MGSCCSIDDGQFDEARGIHALRQTSLFSSPDAAFFDSCITPMCSPNKMTHKMNVIEAVSNSVSSEDLKSPSYFEDPILHFTVAPDSDSNSNNNNQQLPSHLINNSFLGPNIFSSRKLEIIVIQRSHCPYRLIDIIPDTPLFHYVEHAFASTNHHRNTSNNNNNNNNNKSNRSYEIRSIKRIENPKLWTRYAQARSKMEKLVDLGIHQPCRQPRPPVHSGLMSWAKDHLEMKSAETTNEVLLFHGTKPHAVDKICESGLDCVKHASAAGCFGAASYFAENISKSEGYAPRDTNKGDGKSCYMFLCRVLLGSIYECPRGTLMQYIYRPPCVHGHVSEEARNKKGELTIPQLRTFPSCKLHRQADSLVGNNPREFVVFENDRVYPELLVEFAKV